VFRRLCLLCLSLGDYQSLGRVAGAVVGFASFLVGLCVDANPATGIETWGPACAKRGLPGRGSQRGPRQASDVGMAPAKREPAGV